MTTQVATTVPQPPMPEIRLSVEFDGSAARISIGPAEDGPSVEVGFYIPRAEMTGPEALEAIAALRVLLAAAEAALTANDGVGEREGEGWEL